MKKTLLYILCAASAVSCQYKFSLQEMSRESKFFINCLPSNEDSTFISVYLATPVSSGGGYSNDASQADVKMFCNGEELEIRKTASLKEGIPAGTRYVRRKFSPGDRIRVEADMQGLERAYAEAVAPDAFPEFGINLRRTSEMAVDIEYQGVPDKEHPGYYGVQILRETLITYGGTESVFNITSLQPVNEGLTNNDDKPFGTVGSIYNVDIYGGTLVFWSDEDLPAMEADGKRRQSIPVKYLPDDEPAGTYSKAGEEGMLRYRYKFRLFCLTKETFHYLYARYSETYDILGSTGLAPVSFSYSNVKGGYGILGPVSVTETGWFDNPAN